MLDGGSTANVAFWSCFFLSFVTQNCLLSKEKLWGHSILVWDPFCLLY